jgi:hypothetical protein
MKMKRIAIFLIIFSIFFSCKNENKKTDNTSENTTESQTILEPIDIVNLFVESLGKKDFETAYNLQKVESWGNYEKFSSTSSFGGINATSINEIKKLDDEEGKTVIYVDAYYYDPINGNNQYKQNFYLEKINEEWKITKLKVVDTEETITKDNSEIAEIEKLHEEYLWFELKYREMSNDIFFADLDFDGVKEAIIEYCIKPTDQDMW